MTTDEEIKTMCWYSQQCVNEINRFVDLHVKGKEPAEHILSLKQLFDLCPKGARLLDMGTGSAMVAEHCKKFQFYGCDLPHMILGCAMRNQPDHFYKVCDVIEDELAWIKSFDIVLLNAVIDVMYNGSGILRRVLTHAGRYVIIHRQEITEQGESRSVINNSYNSKTYHSIINRREFNALVDEMGFDIVKEVKLNFGNWENGGSSFLLVNRSWQDPRYELPSLHQLKNRILTWGRHEQEIPPLKIIIGAGAQFYDYDWIATNQEELDVESKYNWQLLFGDRRANVIFAEHVWEHLGQPELALKNVYDYLDDGGVLRIAVPDGYHPDQQYIDYVKPGGHGPGADDHKNLWNCDSLSSLLLKVGFTEVTPLEYWLNGRFHKVPYSEIDGRVTRSFTHDPRNQGKPIYTSLIIDAIKY